MRYIRMQRRLFAARQAMQILIVEDESKLAHAIQQGLEEEGYSAALALSGEEALRLLERGAPDLVLLDVMLPKRNGISVLRELRRDGFHVPVLLLTALDTVEDRVLGLDAGGYVRSGDCCAGDDGSA